MLTRITQAVTANFSAAAPRGSRPTVRVGRRWAQALRLATVLLCLGVAASVVDLNRTIAELQSISMAAFLLAVALHLLIILTLSCRWWLVARALGASLSFPFATRQTFLSTFANLLLPTSVSGDVGRIWLVRRHGLDVYRSMLAGIFDRVVGLVTLCAMAIVATAAAPGLVPGPLRALLWATLAAFVVAVLISAALAGSWRSRWHTGSPIALLATRPMLASVGLSVAGHAVAVVIAVVLARDMSVSLNFGGALALFPVVLLASSIPISIGGWGVRELAAVAVFPLIGMSGDAAMAMTLAFGLTQTAAAGLGTLPAVIAGLEPESQ